MSKTLQFNTACKDDSGHLAQKSKNKKVILLVSTMTLYDSVLLSNITFCYFSCAM